MCLAGLPLFPYLMGEVNTSYDEFYAAFCEPNGRSLGGVPLRLPGRIVRRGFGVHDAEAVFRHACRRRRGRAPRAERGVWIVLKEQSAI